MCVCVYKQTFPSNLRLVGFEHAHELQEIALLLILLLSSSSQLPALRWATWITTCRGLRGAVPRSTWCRPKETIQEGGQHRTWCPTICSAWDWRNRMPTAICRAMWCGTWCAIVVWEGVPIFGIVFTSLNRDFLLQSSLFALCAWRFVFGHRNPWILVCIASVQMFFSFQKICAQHELKSYQKKESFRVFRVSQLCVFHGFYHLPYKLIVPRNKENSSNSQRRPKGNF